MPGLPSHRLMGHLPVALLVAGLAAGCSGGTASHDAVFLGTGIREVGTDRCEDDTGLCVVVSGEVDGTATGEGACRIYGPGDPERLEPLAESGPLELVPGETTEWVVALPGATEVRMLNPVCAPMIEG